MSGQYGVCISCGASMLWVDTEHGKGMPLDPEPSTIGNVVISKLVDGREVARVLTPSNVEYYQDGRPRYTSHLATCPNAARHRRRDR